jgi:WD40 repeat protein
VGVLAFSPDGRILATGSQDQTVCLVDTSSGQLLHQLRGFGTPVASLTFSPDSRTLAVGTAHDEQRNGSVSLWDVLGGRRLPPSLQPRCGVAALAFNRSGSTLAVGDADGNVRLWAPNDVRPTFANLAGPVGGEAWSVAFSPDGRTLAVGYDDEAGNDRQTLTLWDAATRQPRATLQGHEAMVFAVAFSPDGRTLASASHDRTVKLWDPQSGRLRATLTGHAERVRSLSYSPDGGTLVTSSHDGMLKVWDVAAGRQRLTLPTGSGHRVTFAPDGKRLAASLDQTVRVWEMPSGTGLREFADSDLVRSLAFAPDGRTLASGNESGVVTLWDLATGGKKTDQKEHAAGVRGGVLSLAYSRDGRTLASGGEDRTIRLWQAATGAHLLCLDGQPAAVNCVAFSPDGRTLAAAIHDGSVRLWELKREEKQNPGPLP